MTTHTDRIRQMAQEADPEFGNLDGDMPDALCGIEAIIRFAQLVAEDCARIVDDETDKAMDECMLGMDAYHAAEYSTKAIRARYSLKD